MPLEEFEDAEGREGHIYELSRGVVAVTDVPHPRHLFQVSEIRKQLAAYEATHPDAIYCIASGE